jgi:hypothetical protein
MKTGDRNVSVALHLEQEVMEQVNAFLVTTQIGEEVIKSFFWGGGISEASPYFVLTHLHG